jgi:Deoxyribonuclease NucA/NucB
MQSKMDSNNEKELTRNTAKSAIRANRRAALATATKGGPGTSLDEFPFASSQEGGAGANVKPISTKEQNKQGGKMSAFYKKNNITNGSKFIVKII